MTDIKSPEERSRNMAAIKGKDTGPEQYVCHELFARGYRYRKNVDYIEGHPDIFLRKHNTAIFVHGCFWHRHKGCRYAYTPKSRIEFWMKKFRANMERDDIVRRKLKEKGIKYLVIWECTVKKMQKDEAFRNLILTDVEEFLIAKEVMFAEY